MKLLTGDGGHSESFSSAKHPASDCLNIPFLKPSISHRAGRGSPSIPADFPLLSTLTSRVVFPQPASECRTLAPASTLKPRACPCGRAECTTTCKSLPSPGLLHWQRRFGDRGEGTGWIQQCVLLSAGTKGLIKYSRTFVTERFVNRCSPRKVSLSIVVILLRN